jgi:hypothetical protein
MANLVWCTADCSGLARRVKSGTSHKHLVLLFSATGVALHGYCACVHSPFTTLQTAFKAFCNLLQTLAPSPNLQTSVTTRTTRSQYYVNHKNLISCKGLDETNGRGPDASCLLDAPKSSNLHVQLIHSVWSIKSL